MNQKTLNISIFVVIILALIMGAAYLLMGKKQSFRYNPPPVKSVKNKLSGNIPANNKIIGSKNSPDTSNESANTATTGSKNQIYENQYMKIGIPAGWTAKQAVTIEYDNGVRKTLPNPAAVNITKGNYILYINAAASQASGIASGRFTEIAAGAPSAEAVIKEKPKGSCGASETDPVFANYVRYDFYVNKQQRQDWCNAPASGSTVWYFTYIGPSNGDYFNYYKDGVTGYVITMAYNSKDVNKLPAKGSAELKTMLNEMTHMVKTLKLKRQ